MNKDLEWEYLKYKKEHSKINQLNENVRFKDLDEDFFILLTPSQKRPSGFYFKFLFGKVFKKIMPGVRVSLKYPIYLRHSNDDALVVIHPMKPIQGDHKEKLIKFMNMSIFNYPREYINYKNVKAAQELAKNYNINLNMYQMLIMEYNLVYGYSFERTINLKKNDTFDTKLYMPIDYDMPKYENLPIAVPD